MAERVLDMAALFVSQGKVQVRVCQRRGKFDGSEQMLDRFVRIAQLLEDAAQVEFGERVLAVQIRRLPQTR